MKILLATDGSESSLNAAEFVQRIAENNQIDVTVLTVSYDPTAYSTQPWLPEWTVEEEKRTNAVLDKVHELLRGCCQSVALVHKSGATVRCILDQATKTKADLIVLGAKGHSAIRRVLLGSISDSVATHATCSVLVVRPTAHPDAVPHRIVVGFDTSAASREAVAEMMELKWQPDTSVNVVSVVQQPQLYFGEDYAGPSMTIEPDQVEAVRRAAERMASMIASDIPKTNTQTPTANHVGSAIVKVAEESHANLVIVGDTGHNLIGELLLGSTSKYVLRHASCSVWISRHHYKADDATIPKEIAAATR